MADFKRQGGTLSGREERYDGFEGEPKAVGSALGGGSTGTTGTTGTTGSGLTFHQGHHGHNDLTGTGSAGSGLTDSGTGTTGSGLTGSGTGTTGSGLTGSGTGAGYDRDYDNTTGTTGTTGKKPGLMDRMNPMKDTDGDGKKGFMK